MLCLSQLWRHLLRGASPSDLNREHVVLVPPYRVLQGRRNHDGARNTDVRAVAGHDSELLNLLLGMASLLADGNDHVSALFKAIHDLEELCPTLGRHFPGSGTSNDEEVIFCPPVRRRALGQRHRLAVHQDRLHRAAQRAIHDDDCRAVEAS